MPTTPKPRSKPQSKVVATDDPGDPVNVPKVETGDQTIEVNDVPVEAPSQYPPLGTVMVLAGPRNAPVMVASTPEDPGSGSTPQPGKVHVVIFGGHGAAPKQDVPVGHLRPIG